MTHFNYAAFVDEMVKISAQGPKPQKRGLSPKTKAVLKGVGTGALATGAGMGLGMIVSHKVLPSIVHNASPQQRAMLMRAVPLLLGASALATQKGMQIYRERVANAQSKNRHQ